MKDQLEDFIRSNRNAFDEKQPSENAWKEIESNVFGTKSIKPSLWNAVWLWRAAAMVFMALSVYLLVPKFTSATKQNTELASLKEFTDVEEFYIQQISEKVELIDEFQKSEGLNGFTHDFQQLEAMYMVLKEEMKTHPSKKVKDALVLNLLVRIDLLNQQLHKLEGDYKADGEKDKKTETNT